jgi:hypothetical protein
LRSSPQAVAKRQEGSFLGGDLGDVIVGEELIELFPENDGEQVQFANSDRKRIGDLAADGLIKAAMDAVAMPGKGEAAAFAATVVVTQPTRIAMVSMLLPTPPGTLERQSRGGRGLLLR